MKIPLIYRLHCECEEKLKGEYPMAWRILASHWFVWLLKTFDKDLEFKNRTLPYLIPMNTYPVHKVFKLFPPYRWERTNT